jgi:2-polyprenyl-6-methoxyphenol hydroxylase-like FAD-dependent oxidoreductase
MRTTDIAIVGGGLAGSLAAAMLGRAAVDTVLIDPNTIYPPDFRCEKLDGGQVEILRKTGLADDVLRAATHDRESWVARFGRLVEKRPGDQYGIYYAPLVNTVRGLVPPGVTAIAAKATAVVTGPERQTLTLSTGETVSARLIVLANGLNKALRQSFGFTAEVLSACHSISIGFDIAPAGGGAFDFPALTYYAERVSDRAALITMFPIGAAMRANLFSYRTMDDPWLSAMRHHPEQTLHALMPGLHKLTGDFAVVGDVQIRPVDLYATRGLRRDGIVLIGDAFATSCPAAGTGARKALNDVERLVNVHIPRWLATPGMGSAKIAEFYDDPVKRAGDEASLAKAYDLRSFSVDPSWRWRMKRRVKFFGHLAIGALRARYRTIMAARGNGHGVPAMTGTQRP